MSQISGTGTIWNLPNYTGLLFTADAVNTPLLTMTGGMNGGQMSNNFEFATDSLYDFPTAAQPAITETASLTAVAGTEAVRAQSKNVCQIFQYSIDLSYEKMASQGYMSGISGGNNVINELDFQTTYALQRASRDIEYSFINGAYQIATNAGVANKTRGILTLANAGTTVAAGSAVLSKSIFQSLLKAMAGAGASFRNPVVMVNAFQKQKLSDVFAYAPTDRNIGGANIKTIETDFGTLGVVYNRFMPTDSLLICDLSVISPVFQAVPEKGSFFVEELAKTGASQRYQLFGKAGLNHGPSFMHGSITGLATA